MCNPRGDATLPRGDDRRARFCGARRRSQGRVVAAIGIDIGTSSAKGVVLDDSGRLGATRWRSIEITRPAPDRFEADALAVHRGRRLTPGSR